MSESSYVVLGLVGQCSSATPYDLKRLVSCSIGYFWDFPHSQLYAEPARLAEMGLLHEVREEGGRRRRLYTISDAGRAELERWLAEPATSVTQIRDEGLLKLFFSDGRDPAETTRLAELQRMAHRARLAEYEALRERIRDVTPLHQISTLEMGLRFERLAVEFWGEVVASSSAQA